MKLPASPPDFSKIVQNMSGDAKKMQAMISNMNITGGVSGGSYDHWERVRFLPPIEPLSPEEVWAAIKFRRMSGKRVLPFRDKNNGEFYFTQIGASLRSLHEIDSNARGLIGMPGAAANSENRDVYLQKSLLEEPFSSSVLEGAATTREVARKMIEEGRKPKTVSEHMVFNNYQAMS